MSAPLVEIAARRWVAGDNTAIIAILCGVEENEIYNRIEAIKAQARASFQKRPNRFDDTRNKPSPTAGV